MNQTNYKDYLKMWNQFADKKAKGYSTGGKYELTNIVGLTGMAREYQIFRMLDLQPQDVLIDVGCASGRQVFRAARQCRKAVGIDVGENFIRFAKNFAEEKQIKNTEFLLTDGQKIPFPESTFDKLICSEVLEHVPDVDIMLDDLIRVVKPGGILVLTVPNWNSRGTFYKRLKNGFRPFPFKPITDFSMEGIKDHGDAHVRQFNFKTFSELAVRHGLRVERTAGAAFLDAPKLGPILEITNRFRVFQQLSFAAEKLLAHLPLFKYLGRHIVLKARKVK